DEVLKEAAQRIKQSLRASDQPARLGGDEFAVILHDIQRPEDALTVAQHVLDVLKQPYPVGEREFDLSASIGIALYPDHATEVKALLHAADDAMYQVKRNGKNQCQLAQNRAQPSVSI
ncbi:MAG: diguanylate cyclase domain-containing protein, partial [Aquaspirillum sp.]